jgi:hypothetical protein
MFGRHCRSPGWFWRYLSRKIRYWRSIAMTITAQARIARKITIVGRLAHAPPRVTYAIIRSNAGADQRFQYRMNNYNRSSDCRIFPAFESWTLRSVLKRHVVSGVEGLNDNTPAVISGVRSDRILQRCNYPDSPSGAISWGNKQWSPA